MKRTESPSVDHATLTAAPEPELYVSPYLHRFPDRVESPVTGAILSTGDPLAAALRSMRGGDGFHGHLGAADLERLVAGGFLVDDVEDASRRGRLLYANVETCSTCNHRCAFCPVSIDPREKDVMPQALFVRIVDEVLEMADPEMVFFLNNYNEPTVDPLFLERLEVLFARKVRVALLTNASRLTPGTTDAIRAMGTLRYLGVNLPTLDAPRYREMHGTSDLPAVLRNVDYVLDHPVATENAFVVLGYDDERHAHDFEAITSAYAAHPWSVKKFRVQNRAGLVSAPVTPVPKRRLAGCDLVGSRPLQHLQVVASGKVTFCCQDYYEHHVVADLKVQSVQEAMASPGLAQLRKWAYGAEEAPADFICRGCEFALEAEEGVGPSVSPA
jgi:pyruvate-formate lyase-activating enzyme